MNKECEHEWVETKDNISGGYFEMCLKCGEPKPTLVIGVDNIAETRAYLSSLNPHEFKPPRDFKIEENLSQINIQQWEDIQNEFYKFTNQWGINQSYSEYTKWLKENYLPPVKK